MSQLKEQESNDPSYFGGCPKCHQNDGCYLNVGRTHWYFCSQHKTKWAWGSNLVSSWRDESEKDWTVNYEFLRSFAEVTPVYPPAPPPMHDIVRVLEYLRDEYADFVECNSAEKESHIFLAIRNVQSWVDEQLSAAINLD